MDRETLSHYGWIVIIVLVLMCLLGTTTPFGNFIADGFKATYVAFFHASDDSLDSVLKTVDTPEDLQAKYHFDYYRSVALAAADINDATIGKRADVEKEDAVAGIFIDKNGTTTILLLKDNLETEIANLLTDVTLNLGGHKLSYNNNSGDKALYSNKENNIIIDGRLQGSEIEVQTTTKTAKLIVAQKANVTILGGKYNIYSQSNQAAGLQTGGNASVENAEMNVGSGNKTTICVYTSGTGKNLVVKNSVLTAYSSSPASTLVVAGIQSTFNSEVSDTKITSYVTTSGTNTSYGITNKAGANMVVNNCEITAIYSAINNHGTIEINGGTYSSGHYGGGLYAGESHIRDARLTYKILPENGLDISDIAYYKQGLAIGNNDNFNVYIDNCLIETNNDGKNGGIMLSYPLNTKSRNFGLYISNCDITSDTIKNKFIRIDHNTYKLYVGAGNTFNGDPTWDKSKIVWINTSHDSTATNATIVKTEETYR